MAVDLLLKLLTRYFYRTPVPESFGAIQTAKPRPIIVTNSDSLIVQGLLASFALRSGMSGIKRWPPSGAEGRSIGSDDSNVLQWVNLHDEPLLKKLASEEGHTLSTLNIFSLRGPTSSNPVYRLGFGQRLSILLLSRFLFIVFGEPIKPPPSSARRHITLSRLLKLDFYQNLRVVRGTPFQSIEAQARAILGGAEYEREIAIVAQRSRESKSAVLRKARREFFEMAAHPRRFMYWLLAPVAAFVIRRLFSRVLVTGLESFEQAVRQDTVVMVPMHRSHLDYIILSTTLYQSRINPPIVAAGVNLRFWPAGFFIRSLGAYFVKRNARHDRIHALLLRRYVTYLVKRGHLQEFFIEGGRSRSGKMRPPKLGILSIIADAYLKGVRRDILFVPVSISYENVIEDTVFGEENTGQVKKKESFVALLKARSIFQKKYGDVSLHFGEPISIEQFDKKFRAGPDADSRGMVLELASVLTRTIRDQTTLSLSSLAYTALMMAPRYSLRRTELVEVIRDLAALAEITAPARGDEARLSPALRDFISGKYDLLNDLPRGGVISLGSCLGEDVFIVRGTKRFTADFYKNATIHLFFEVSLLAVVELLGLPLTSRAAAEFHPYFEQEFLLPPLPDFCRHIDGIIRCLQDGKVLTDGDSPRFTDRRPGAFFPGLLLGSLQALLWVVQNLRHSQAEMKVDAGSPVSIPYESFLGRLLSDFKSAGYCGLVTRTEASSQAALMDALENLQQRKLLVIQEASGNPKEITHIRDLVEEEQRLKYFNDIITAWQYRTEPVPPLASNAVHAAERFVSSR